MVQYQAQVYLWLKEIVPRADVLALRKQVFAALAEDGLAQEASDPVEGSRCREQARMDRAFRPASPGERNSNVKIS